MQRLRRRSVLAGAGAVGTGLFAGCADDGDDDSSGPLRLEEFLFLSEDPPGYGDYKGLVTDSYRPGDRVRLYLDPAGVSVQSTETGATYDLTARVTVRDPNGVAVADGEDVVVTATDTAGNLDELYFLPSIPLRLQSVSGTYTATVELVDESTGRSTTERQSFDVTALSPDPLAIGQAQFVAEAATGYRQYRPLEQPSYEPGETVRLYVEPRGVEPRVRDQPNPLEYELDMGLLLLPPGDAEIDGKEVTFSGSTADRAALSELFFNVSYELPDDVPAGQYQLRIDLTDRNADADASTVISFRVE